MRLESVQILRGIVPMAVVFEHSCWLLGSSADRLGESVLAGLGSLPELFSIGGDLLFVFISGFVMAFGAQRFSGAPVSGHF